MAAPLEPLDRGAFPLRTRVYFVVPQVRHEEAWKLGACWDPEESAYYGSTEAVRRALEAAGFARQTGACNTCAQPLKGATCRRPHTSASAARGAAKARERDQRQASPPIEFPRSHYYGAGGAAKSSAT